MRKAAVFGLGKLGLPTVCYFAKKFKMIGVDVNKAIVEDLKQGKVHISERGIPELLKERGDNIEFTDDVSYAAREADIGYIIVPTPSLEHGRFDSSYVEKVFLEICEKAVHQFCIVITSTLMPGETDRLCSLIPPNKKAIITVLYSPDFIALGSVVRDLENPDILLVGKPKITSKFKQLEGAWSRQSTHRFTDMHEQCRTAPRMVHEMSYSDAELAKIAINSYCTMKITFANYVALHCDDPKKVLAAIGDDTRVGRRFLNPGLGYGGPCLPRDNKAFAHVIPELEYPYMTDTLNQELDTYWCEQIYEARPEWLGILGVTYKMGHPSREESAVGRIIRSLTMAETPNYLIYDPETHDKETFSKFFEKCDVFFIGLPYPEFAEINFKGKKVIDPWRIL